MERASKVIRGLKLSGDVISAGRTLCAAWPEAVGKKIAGHTRAANWCARVWSWKWRTHTWQRQLFALSSPHS